MKLRRRWSQWLQQRHCAGLASFMPLLLVLYECARTQACFVSTLKSVHLRWSHQKLKKRLDTLLGIGCRNWNIWVPKLLSPFYMCAPKERLPPLDVWYRALARVAMLPDVFFVVLGSKPSLVPSEETESKEATKDTGILTKRKRGDK